MRGMVIVEYLEPSGKSPFAVWFERIPCDAAAKVAVALARLELGNISNIKSVGNGVSECRIDYGPGYRIYFGRDGQEIIILLAGGTKKRQQRDIEDAHARWQTYKQRKAGLK